MRSCGGETRHTARLGGDYAGALFEGAILAAPLGDPLWQEATGLDDVPTHTLRELEHFVDVYKDLEDKKTAVVGWRPLDVALTIIQEARDRYQG